MGNNFTPLEFTEKEWAHIIEQLCVLYFLSLITQDVYMHPISSQYNTFIFYSSIDASTGKHPISINN